MSVNPIGFNCFQQCRVSRTTKTKKFHISDFLLYVYIYLLPTCAHPPFCIYVYLPVGNVHVVEELDSNADVLHYLCSLCNRLKKSKMKNSKEVCFQFIFIKNSPLSLKDCLSWILLNSSPPDMLQNSCSNIKKIFKIFKYLKYSI